MNDLLALDQAPIATFEEALHLLEQDRFYGRGFHWNHIQILASAVIAAFRSGRVTGAFIAPPPPKVGDGMSTGITYEISERSGRINREPKMVTIIDKITGLRSRYS